MNTLDPVVNFGDTTVTTAPSPALSGTSLVLTSPSLLPDPGVVGAYNITIHPANAIPSSSNSEIVRVTAKSGIAPFTFTITRAQEGTAARSIVAGDRVLFGITKKLRDDIQTNLSLFNSEIIILQDEPFSLSRQSLINGNFDCWIDGVTFTPNDDTYVATIWNALVETNGSWTFARNTDVPSTKSKYSLKCSNVTANNQCAIVQFIENVDAVKLAGRLVSLSFAAKTTGLEIGNLRATVLSWNSTADVITSDVIGTWAQNGTDPTWATNWTAEKAGSNLALTNSWQTFQINNIDLDTSGITNLAVIIWVDDGTITTGDDFWVTQVQLNVGSACLPFQPQFTTDEENKIGRVYQQSYSNGVAPGSNTGAGAHFFAGGSNGSQDVVFAFSWRRRMRTTPTLTFYRQDGTVGSWAYSRSGASGFASMADAGATNDQQMNAYAAGIGATWVAATIFGHYKSDARL